VAEIRVFKDLEELSEAVAQQWIQLSQQAVRSRGTFHVALSGGSTPRFLFEKLATLKIADQIDWMNTHCYFGDERSVPPDHADSNFRMAKESLFDQVNIPPSQIYRMQAEKQDIKAAAKDYAAVLQKTLTVDPAGVVQFDLVLLGMGDDGHTASLFPATDILRNEVDLVAAVYVEKLHTWRMSITFPVINHARNIWILVAGRAKADVLQQVLAAEHLDQLYPIQMIKPQGVLEWFVDAAAAQKLMKE
jgi:6-phosphogluconolactonase